MAEDKEKSKQKDKVEVRPVENQDTEAKLEPLDSKAKELLPAALEVEKMPESSELQKRREQTKKRLKELSELSDDESAAFSDEDGGGFMDMVRESGLTGRHIKFCCGIVVLLGIVLSVVFGGVWNFVVELWPEGNEDTVVTDDPEADEGDEGELFDSLIEVGIKLGFEEAEEDESTTVAESIGSEESSDNRFSRLIEDFEEVYNSMQVDVIAMLDQSSDRQLSLDKYLEELNELYEMSRLNYKTLSREAEELVDEFHELEDEKNSIEERFFEDINELDGDGSVDSLDDFIEISRDLVEIRAKYRARAKVLAFYERGIEALELRIKDLEYNSEALVKGVRVVDIAGSDIDLIVEEDEL